MKSEIRVAKPPPKPLMVFDGDCNFCTLWIRRWQQATGDSVDYLPAQDPRIKAQFPEIPAERFDTAVQLIEPDGAVYSGAEAVFRALAQNPSRRWSLRCYQNSGAFAKFTECSYSFVARHRPLFSFFTRWLWGRHVDQPAYFLVRWIFLRGLGAIYLIAFLSLWVQITGLIGSHGILPADRLMSDAKQYFDSQDAGLSRYHAMPTLCWFNASDGFLKFQCAAGVALAALLIAGVAPGLCLALLWLFYLSLVTVGRDFLGFQWDNLLLETGFLAIFFAPLQWLPRRSREAPPSRLVLWLLRWLLFRLMFESGCIKLLSGDPMWRHLTALTVHYQTQPLPTWIGWYAHQLPAWAQEFSCVVMFGIELLAPFLIFSPRRPRFLACAALVALQILILLTGNYTFFNLITIALCVLLLDDFAIEKMMPSKLRSLFPGNSRPPVAPKPGEGGSPPSFFRRWPRAVTVPLALVIIAISLFQMIAMVGVSPRWLMPVVVTYEWIAPFRSVNNYGLFAVMTAPRREIVVEGSDDGVTWRPYEFKYKPGDVNRRPGFVEPHQPRLDWQMWFAALGSWRQNPWFANFCVRLLQGSPEVLALLEKNPFPDRPPRYIRAVLYEYRFTNFAERRITGAWWKRELKGEYLPPVSINQQPSEMEGERPREL
jgi:predicted DCC family thiol-disulfide oxidoreductase YuxK